MTLSIARSTTSWNLACSKGQPLPLPLPLPRLQEPALGGRGVGFGLPGSGAGVAVGWGVTTGTGTTITGTGAGTGDPCVWPVGNSSVMVWHDAASRPSTTVAASLRTMGRLLSKLVEKSRRNLASVQYKWCAWSL